MAADEPRLSRLPPTRKGRSGLLRRNSSEYIRRMGRSELDRLLLALSRTRGLSEGDVECLDGVEWFNVDWVYVPDRFKE